MGEILLWRDMSVQELMFELSCLVLFFLLGLSPSFAGLLAFRFLLALNK